MLVFMCNMNIPSNVLYLEHEQIHFQFNYQWMEYVLHFKEMKVILHRFIPHPDEKSSKIASHGVGLITE